MRDMRLSPLMKLTMWPTEMAVEAQVDGITEGFNVVGLLNDLFLQISVLMPSTTS